MNPKMQPPRPRFWAKLAVALGIALPLLLVIVTLPWPFGRSDHLPLSTQNRMKQWGLILNLYANESERGYWPPLARNGRLWAPDLTELCPEYLSPANTDVLVAREHPDRDAIRVALEAILGQPNPDYDTAAGLMALSYAYLGYGVDSIEDFWELAEALGDGSLEDIDSEEKLLPVIGRTYRLRRGVERFFITDINGPAAALSELMRSIPVIVETWGWWNQPNSDEFRGANVLYMDGHVEFVPLGTFPVVPEVMDVLSGMNAGPHRQEPNA